MRIYLSLSEEERSILEGLLKRSPKPYLRERASAILQIASGSFGNEVASKGLLVHRRKNTVYDWVVRYKAEGIKGLEIKAGRGRKPGFSPSEHSSASKPSRTSGRSKPK